jgi:hypothetical protein
MAHFGLDQGKSIVISLDLERFLVSLGYV